MGLDIMMTNAKYSFGVYPVGDFTIINTKF